ncbi:hypothetical protein M9Y10_017968 [Tritrichomonas musculus]|uniref:Uncharacterized protein n=1 Tax=Tritrichomonas musculus TaxID=1915356 RepID=A0ABR2HV85_9EUKA
MTQFNKKVVIGLNIHLISFSLLNDLVNDGDEIRVGITTIPEEKKQHFYIKKEKMCCSNYVFALNITNQTSKILFVFRKRDQSSNEPIIASTVVCTSDFPKMLNKINLMETGIINTGIKEINIYDPIQKHNIEIINKNYKRAVIGKMRIQLSFSTPYPENNRQNMSNCNDKHGQIKTIKFKPIEFNINYENIIKNEAKYDCYNDYILF